MKRSLTETSDTVAMSATSMIGFARERLKAALELLGTFGDETVSDDAVVGAGILAHEAGDALEELFEHRLAEQSKVGEEGEDG